ncbi:HAD family hydrolase [Qipengyuania sp.]|uniref:HAD family hydrolase n=1 Tax=Qipengyuania sp. TaxID=2004515 RepID=UPI0035C813E4
MLVIFDCDGVLVDSELLVTDVHVRALRECGLDISHDELHERFLGMTDRAMYRELARDLGRPLPGDYDRRVKAEIIRRSETELKPVAGVETAVAAITGPRCVASSSSEYLLHQKLKITGLAGLFGNAIFSADAVRHGKPAPDIFLYAAERMGVRPSECIVIEDSENGVRAGVAAGMRVIGFAGASHVGPGHAERLKEAGAERVITRLDALPSLVARAFLP